MLNYTVPPFRFLIGSFDASEYLDSINLSVPMHEIGTDLMWTGDFKVSYNLKAQREGFAEGDFSEVTNPSRWRPYQQPVRLEIKGYPSPVFRIENYRYNAHTNEGEGKLVQLPVAISGDRPGVQIPLKLATSEYAKTNLSGKLFPNGGFRTTSLRKGRVGSGVRELLKEAFKTCRIQPAFNVLSGDDRPLIDPPLVTRDPFSDAVRICSLLWQWLSVDTNENVVTIDGTISQNLFTRSLIDVELAPDLSALFQPANKVVVTGAARVLDIEAIVKLSNSDLSNDAIRPKFNTTEELRPSGTVFPSADTTPILFEQKTIIYQYFDDVRWSEYLPQDKLTNFIFDIESVSQNGINKFAPKPADLSAPLQTITIKRQPIGFLFPSLGNNTALTEAEVIIESSIRRLILKPEGLVFGNNTNTNLIVEKRESLTSEIIPVHQDRLVALTLNRNGFPQQYEPQPRLEQPNPLADSVITTVPVRGEMTLKPLGWTPIYIKPFIVDLGTLPDLAQAKFLAGRIAIREQRRRDQALVNMPIPNEWLASGWGLLKSCTIGQDVYLMDGCAISIASNQATFGFTGALISKGKTVVIDNVPTVVQVPLYQIEIEIEDAIVFEAELTYRDGLKVDLTKYLVEPNIIFEAEITSIVGNSISTNLDVKIVFEGEVTSIARTAEQTLTFSVTPSSQLEGNPTTEQTLTFSVSPSSQLEGSPVTEQTLTFSVTPSSQLEGNPVAEQTLTFSVTPSS